MKIEYKGKVYTTNIPYVELTDEQFEELRNEYYSKPPIEDVYKQMQKVHEGKSMVNVITKYYLREIMADVVIRGCKWCINDVFNNKELLSLFYSKTLLNDKVFNSTTLNNINTAIRLGGAGLAKQPNKFPIKTVRDILSKYNVNNNYYDFSCGWGDRLLGALSTNVNYFGTDPNYLLVDKLYQIAIDYDCANNIKSNVDIKAQGSEIFIPEYENKMGLAFSSPPYFDLEDYKHGKQSYNENVSYEQWLRNFIVPTFKNIKRYLVEDGYFALNIKNQKKYKMLDDCIELAKAIGFKLHDVHELKNITRVSPAKKDNLEKNSIKINNNEQIVVFTK